MNFDLKFSSKKLLIVAEFDSLNGGENSMLAVLPLLLDSGWRIKIAFPNQKSSTGHQMLSDRIAGLDLRPVTLTTHLLDGTRKSQSQYRSDFADLVKSHQPNLVWCNSLSTSRLCGPVTHALGVASIGYLRDIIKLSNKAVEDINQLDHIVAVSRATKNFHVNQGMTHSKVTVIYNGVDLDLFKPAPEGNKPRVKNSRIKEELGIPSDSPALLFVGQIGMRKGVDVLLEAFGRVVAQLPKCHLLIVGQRHSVKKEAVNYEADLIRRSRSTALVNKVHWLQRRDDMPAIYQGVDLLLHPARQEPLGRVILEAVACGLPVLTTFVGGSPEILGCNDSFDLLFPVDDAQAMANRAITMLQDQSLHRAVSEELREMAVRRFDRHRCHTELSNLIDDVLANQSAAGDADKIVSSG